MRQNYFRQARVGWVALLVLSGGVASLLHGKTPLTADEVMQKAVERARWSASQPARPNYTYTKITLTEELDATGKVKDRTERFYEGVFDAGLTYLRLVKVNGKVLPASELKKQEQRELKDRETLAQRKTVKGGDDRENFLTAELIAKYKFAIVDRQPINGRPTYVLTYQPRPGLPLKHVADRLLNQLAGKLWIDEQEFEIAKIEVHLQSEVTLWGGLLASLKRFTFTLTRVRLEDGVWFNTVSNGDFEGRKLLDNTHVRTQSESTNFRRIDRWRG
ncbi:MAG: hypothetical protein HY298_01085 [Verrucomicrobia bacterium]|nr:hypothetical protein [Verrucomicrobiota bacterium]